MFISGRLFGSGFDLCIVVFLKRENIFECLGMLIGLVFIVLGDGDDCFSFLSFVIFFVVVFFCVVFFFVVFFRVVFFLVVFKCIDEVMKCKLWSFNRLFGCLEGIKGLKKFNLIFYFLMKF